MAECNGLDFVGAGTARLEFAVLALKDVPMRSGMAHTANPLNECGFGLEEVEGVVAVSRDCHGEREWGSAGAKSKMQSRESERYF